MKKIILTFLIIILITSSFTTTLSQKTIENKKELKSKILLMEKQEKNQKNIVNQNINNYYSMMTTGGDIALSTLLGDEFYPSMVINKNNLFIAYEYEGSDNKNNIYFRSSQDYGSSWSNQEKLDPDFVRNGKVENIEIETKSPSIDIVPNQNHIYGGFVSSFNNSGVIGILNITNIFGNQNNWEKYAFDWSNVTDDSDDSIGSFSDFSNPDALALDVAYTPYMISLIGSTTYENESTEEGPCTMSPMFFFEYDLGEPGNPDIYYILTWYSEFSNCSNLKIANNYGDDQIYGICEIRNNTNQDLLFLRASVDEIYEDEEIYNMTFKGSENLTNPNIFVKNSKIYVVAETDFDSSKDIVLYVSDDEGVTWDERRITDTEYDSKYPVIHVNETHIKCVYVEFNNLISSISNDDGVTWGNIEMLNGEFSSVVPGFYNCDMADMDHIVWSDIRNDDYDLYLYISDLPIPDLTAYNLQLEKGINFLPTKNWISFIVQNKGSAVATDVYIEISYKIKDEDPVTIPYPVIIPTLNPFSEQEKSQSLFKGIELLTGLFSLRKIEQITVHVDPEKQIDDSDRSNNDITIPASYGDIYPFLGRFIS